MTCLRCISKIHRPHLNQNSFKDSWRDVLKKSNFNHLLTEDDQKECFFENVIINSELIAKINMIFNEKIDYSNYSQADNVLKNRCSIYECFHGILFYIFYYSQNKLNIEELQIHFSGAKNLYPSKKKKFNILNIFDYTNIDNIIEIGSYKNAFFGVTFKNIKVKPVAFSIRSGFLLPQSSHLISFTFEGYDKENQKWDILSEHTNINELIQSGGFGIYYVRSSDKCYSSFKIKQTMPSHNDMWGFSLAAFEIHGVVYYCDEKDRTNDNIFEENDEQNFAQNSFDINPFMDMSVFMI